MLNLVSVDNSFDDNILVSLAKSGDSVALSRLIERYSNIVLQKAKSFNNLNGLDSEDLYQEGMIGFVSSIYSFDESRGAKFSTYSVVLAVNKMLTAIRDSNNDSSMPMIAYVSLDDSLELLSHSPSPEEFAIYRDELAKVMEYIEDNLSKKERKVFKLILLGVSYSEIADIIDCSVKSVDNSIQRIRRKIRAFKAEQN